MEKTARVAPEKPCSPCDEVPSFSHGLPSFSGEREERKNDDDEIEK